MDDIKIKNRIAEVLDIRGITAAELSKLTGFYEASVSHWIKQDWQPKQKALMAMARVLDVSEMWLAGYDVPMERAPEQKRLTN